MNSNINRVLVLLIVSAFTISSCEPLPELAIEPKIFFNDVIFVPGGEPGGFAAQDTLRVLIDFEDGDGNLGIEADNDDSVYQEFYYLTPTGHLIANFDENRVIRFGEPGQPEFNFEDWFVGFQNGDSIADTVRVQYNENFHNFFIDFYQRKDTNNDGDITDDEDYEKIDIASIFGGVAGFGFNARFFVLNTSESDRPLRGTLTYEMISAFRISPVFRNNTLKVEIKIRDRNFNESNVVSSPDFVMQ